MSGGSVLVVDDSDVTRAVLRRYLQQAGFEVIEARDGAEAAVGALREQPQVVVTDLEMPVMDGYQLARLLKNDPGTSHMPVIILTSHHEATSRFWGQHAGADAYLTKDQLDDELIATVARLMEEVPPRTEAPENPPSNPLEVLARVARHLDEGLMDATLINQVLQIGMETSSFGAAARTLLDLLSQVVDAELLGISVVDNRGLRMHLLRPPQAATRIDLGELSSFVSRRLRLDGAEVSILRLDGEVSNSGPQLETDSAVVFELPLRDARGMISVWPRRRELFEGLPQNLLTKATPHAALVLDNVRLAEHLWELSTHDGLTRLLNHRSILGRLDEEVGRASRYQSQLSIVLCDIDRFKLLNDTYGHLMGDAVLREVATRLKNGLRTSDVVGRYGGEEFLAILPNTELEAALHVARRICASLSEAPVRFAADQSPVVVTASFGVAAVTEVDDQRLTQSLLSLADSRLYAAKDAGRACVRP